MPNQDHEQDEKATYSQDAFHTRAPKTEQEIFIRVSEAISKKLEEMIIKGEPTETARKDDKAIVRVDPQRWLPGISLRHIPQTDTRYNTAMTLLARDRDRLAEENIVLKAQLKRLGEWANARPAVSQSLHLTPVPSDWIEQGLKLLNAIALPDDQTEEESVPALCHQCERLHGDYQNLRTLAETTLQNIINEAAPHAVYDSRLDQILSFAKGGLAVIDAMAGSAPKSSQEDADA